MHIILINDSKTNKMCSFFSPSLARIRRFLILVKFDSFHHLYFTFFVHLTKYVSAHTFLTWFNAFICAINHMLAKMVESKCQTSKKTKSNQMKWNETNENIRTISLTIRCRNVLRPLNAGQNFTYDTLKTTLHT